MCSSWSAETKYYYFGRKLVAQKQGGALTYFNQDHLTGTSVQSDASGASVATIRYYPFGATRSTTGGLDVFLHLGPRISGVPRGDLG